MKVERHVRRLCCKFNAESHAFEKSPVLLSSSFLQLHSTVLLLVAVCGCVSSCRVIVQYSLLLLQYNLHWDVWAHTAQ